ncbi:hypothetical protein D3C77_480630 [compost metagenome]
MAGIDYRADHRVLRVGVADRKALDPLDETFGKGVVQAVVDDNAVDRHADLPLVQKLAEHCSVHRLFKVGVIEHHKWAVAAQLQRYVLEVLTAAGDSADAASHRGGAGEGDQ